MDLHRRDSLTFDVAFVGDATAAAAWELARPAMRTVWVRVPDASPPAGPVAWLGAGEPAATTALIFGDDVQKDLWALSEENRERAMASPGARALPVHWEAHGALPAAEEKGVWLDTGRLAAHAQKEFAAVVDAGAHPTIIAEGAYCYRLDGISASPVFASLVVVADERWAPRLFPQLREVWLAPAMTTIRTTEKAEPALHLVHGGADFASFGPTGARFGSFRSLYEDRAVRETPAVDTVTMGHVTKFFRDRQWLGSEEETAEVSVEGFSCDGLPIVGPLATHPGVVVCGAFAGRTNNFRFACLAHIARSLGDGAVAPALARLAPRRFA